MSKQSAGILLYRRRAGALQVMLVHPGGPYFVHKDDGCWTIPKGEFDPGAERAIDAARREFGEETGHTVTGDLVALTPIKQRSGKTVHAWAVEGDWDTAALISNSFEMEWPRGSGRMQSFPEVDRAQWFDLTTARRKANPAQVAFIEELVAMLG